MPTVFRAARRLVEEVRPDIIHSHFVTTTMTLRLALGRNHRIQRVFQVPGPLHLEYWATRSVELAIAGDADYWIGSSRCIREHYLRAGAPSDRVFLSYYGWPIENGENTPGFLRRKLSLPKEAKIVGNINLIYPPKYVLGESVGLKGHEVVIDALGEVIAKRDDVYGVLIGSTFGTTRKSYEQTLRQRATKVGKGRLLMPGYFPPSEVRQSWPDFDCAVHLPTSENCGGVVEPLAAGVPVITCDVGGLPEVIIDGVTGTLLPGRSSRAAAAAILEVLSNPGKFRALAANGRRLVKMMFDVNRTATEILAIYQHLLVKAPRPLEFNSESMDRIPTRQTCPPAFPPSALRSEMGCLEEDSVSTRPRAN
jgi:glycosyltransferase involved in cell wall biosynthesis